jgi:hypothetical protein
MIDAFQVWLRPLGESCRVRVNGVRNAEWLLKRLGTSFAVNCEQRRGVSRNARTGRRHL